MARPVPVILRFWTEYFSLVLINSDLLISLSYARERPTLKNRSRIWVWGPPINAGAFLFLMADCTRADTSRKHRMSHPIARKYLLTIGL